MCLSWRTPQSKPAHRELSHPPVAVKFGDVVCKTLKALLGWDQKKEPAELSGVPDDGVGGMHALSCLQAFPNGRGGGLLQHEETPAASQSPGNGHTEDIGIQPSPLSRSPRCCARSKVAGPTAPERAQPCWDGHDAAGLMEGHPCGGGAQALPAEG